MAQNLAVISTRVQFKFDSYDHTLDKAVLKTVSIPRVKREADTDKLLELGEKIATAIGEEGNLLSTVLVRNDDIY